MDSHDQHVEFGSAACQQTRISGFFRNAHSRFSEQVKTDPKGEVAVVASQVVCKKPLLVIGDFGGDVVTPQRPGAVWSDVNGVELKTGVASVQVSRTAQQGTVLSKDTVANGDAAKQPDAGAGMKRKAAESEDVMNKRIDARVREAPLPNTKAAMRKEPESHSVLRGGDEKVVKVAMKKATWEQDSGWTYEPSAAPAFAVPDSLKGSSKVESAKDVIVQQNRNRVQAPPSGTSILPSDSSSQDGPLCQMEEIRVDVDAGKGRKEGLFSDPSTELSNSTDETDSEKCTTSGRRQKKDVFLGENWGLPVDLKGDLFSSKLKEILCKPFDSNESSELWGLVIRRKPVLKLRQTRGRTMHVPSKDEGLSYLDHHPDLAQRLQESSHPAEKLALLRAFFFWLQHSCMEGAFKPWAPETNNCAPEGDCVLTDGPDCEVLAVVLPLDEKNEVSTVVKPLEPVFIDLSDDEDDCTEVRVKSPVKTVPKTNSCENSQKIAACICCFKEFGMEKDRQRALYRTCGHIETCMQCVDRLWKLDRHECRKCGVMQSTKPGSLFDFANSAE